ncbi:MAG: RsbRD N-terminal domain-containing protein [Desulfobulbaceae bacterium]|nr:RsbRD N-terminal domain-containing protein [Desulfobulbaceae bacterium]
MKLSDTLHDKKDKILSIWIDRTLESYISPGFFKKSKDHFANPIGANIRDGLAKVLDLLLQDAAIEEFTKPIDQVIRIRAVQDFTPSKAVVPFLELKWIIRQVLTEQKKNILPDLDMDSLDCDIDRIALMAFDIYTQCREQLYQVRIKELKSGSYILSDSPCPSSLLRKGQTDPSKIN